MGQQPRAPWLEQEVAWKQVAGRWCPIIPPRPMAGDQLREPFILSPTRGLAGGQLNPPDDCGRAGCRSLWPEGAGAISEFLGSSIANHWGPAQIH